MLETKGLRKKKKRSFGSSLDHFNHLDRDAALRPLLRPSATQAVPLECAGVRPEAGPWFPRRPCSSCSAVGPR